MSNAGFRLEMRIYTCLLILVANKKLLDLAAKILLEMKANGFPGDVNAGDVLMIYVKGRADRFGVEVAEVHGVNMDSAEQFSSSDSCLNLA